MELSAANRLKRTAPTTRTTGQTESTSTAKRPSAQQHRTDRLALSQQALNFLEGYNQQIKEKSQKSTSEEDSLLKFLRKASKTMDKCNRIAARVRAGDKVPPEDLEYLRNQDPDGYKLAIATRMPKEHPKEYESILDDEDKQSLTDSASSVSDAQAAAGDVS